MGTRVSDSSGAGEARLNIIGIPQAFAREWYGEGVNARADDTSSRGEAAEKVGGAVWHTVGVGREGGVSRVFVL